MNWRAAGRGSPAEAFQRSMARATCGCNQGVRSAYCMLVRGTKRRRMEFPDRPQVRVRIHGSNLRPTKRRDPYGFSSIIPIQSGGFERARLQPCRKIRAVFSRRKLAALKGHGFSRAVNAAKSVSALAAEGCFARDPSDVL